MVNRVKREEAVLAPIFGERYANYCAEVRRFWPRLAPYERNPVAYFRWSLFLENNAHWNLLAVLASTPQRGLVRLHNPFRSAPLARVAGYSRR